MLVLFVGILISYKNTNKKTPAKII